MPSETPDEQERIQHMGPKMSEWLHAIGIHTFAEIEELGAVETYKRLKAAFPKRVSLNALYGLQAALLNIPWTALSSEMKADLRAQVEDAE